MVALAIEQPTWGQVRVSNELKKRIAKHSDLGSLSMKCLHVSVDHLGEFGSFIRRHVSRGHRFRILTSVDCSAHTASLIADAFKRHPFTDYEPLAEFPNVDGVVALTHKTGCGMAAGEGLQLLRRTLAGYARHPNFSHVIVIGLGCGRSTRSANCSGNTSSLIESATWISRVWAEFARPWRPGSTSCGGCLRNRSEVRRQTVPAHQLKVALQCGGSDGYSGVSANPALGVASDLVVRNGGTVILAETTETYGAEHLFHASRGQPRSWRKAVDLMRWWEEYTHKHGEEINANPSPGNKAGGLTTIIEKSLGAMAKAGSTNLVDVVKYAEAVTQKGFVCMDTPGFDPVAATGQVAGGANIVCFTTGRGSVFGCKPSPSIKIATNTHLFQRMEEDMDINCGTIVDGHETGARRWTADFRAHPAGCLG